MSNQSLRNKNPHRNPIQTIAYVILIEEYGTGDSQSFQVFPRESVVDEDEESVPGQTIYADFDFTVCFLIGGRLTLDYDENMALLKVNRHITLLRIQHYNHPGLQGIPLHQCKYSLKVSTLLSCTELQYDVQG